VRLLNPVLIRGGGYSLDSLTKCIHSSSGIGLTGLLWIKVVVWNQGIGFSASRTKVLFLGEGNRLVRAPALHRLLGEEAVSKVW